MQNGAYPPGVYGKMIDSLEVPMCCGTCSHYNGVYCTKCWNNLDSDYCIPDRDQKEPDFCCDDYEED